MEQVPCSQCGLHFAPEPPRGSLAVSETRRRAMETIGDYMYSERFDSASWFWLPESKVRELDEEEFSVFREAYEAIYRAMGAEKFTWDPRGVRKSPVSITFPEDRPLNPLSKAVKALDAAQLKVLHSMGVGFLASKARVKAMRKAGLKAPYRTRSEKAFEEGADVILTPSILDYVKDRTEGAKPGSTAKTMGLHEARVSGVAALYVKRAWTIHVLGSTGHTSPMDRYTVLRQPKSRRSLVTSSGVEGAVTFRLVLPHKVSEVSPGSGAHVKYLVDPALCPQGSPVLQAMHNGKPARVYHVAGSGAIDIALDSSPILTLTSKMAAPSFSLPAGSNMGGGTCSAADLMRESAYLEKEHICSVCYAMGANYAKAINIWGGCSGLGWTMDTLRDHGAKGLGERLVAAICAYARFSSQAPPSLAGNGFKRSDVEIGVWSKAEGTILAPSRGVLTPMQMTQLDYRGQLKAIVSEATGEVIPNVSGLFAEDRVKDGEVAGFFRIHDSGDFSLPRLPDQYIQAWEHVIRSLPHVYFWAPTRLWAGRYETEARVSPAVARWFDQNEALATAGRMTKKDFVQGVAKKRGSRAVEFAARIADLKEAKQKLLGVRLADDEEIVPGGQEGLIRRLKSKKLPFFYAPIVSQNVRLMMEICRAHPNATIRPSSLYVKTPFNGATIPYVAENLKLEEGVPNALSAGSGVSERWGRKIPKILERGISPDAYVPVFDTLGREAYQCPVYSKLILGKDKDGEPALVEAVSCRQAGCRACWILPQLPIAYGYH